MTPRCAVAMLWAPCCSPASGSIQRDVKHAMPNKIELAYCLNWGLGWSLTHAR